MHIDERLPTPLYHQIYVLLRDKILSGDYPKNSTIPSEHELERLYGVSRITAKRALDELAADGLVARQRGRGTRVIWSKQAPSVVGNVEGLFENVVMRGFKTEAELLEFEYGPASPAAAEALQIEPGVTVQRVVRLRKKDGQAFSYLITHVPEDIGRRFGPEALSNLPMLAVLEKHGVVIRRADEGITAILADNATAPALGVQVGSPLLKVNRVAYDAEGRAVEHLIALYRSDLYQLNIGLKRVREGRINTWAVEG
ncbi:MAG TPA: GntR family transcriptional regulator [Sphingomonadales bacterium]